MASFSEELVPVPADPDTPGCYQSGKIDLGVAPAELYWHVYQFSN